MLTITLSAAAMLRFYGALFHALRQPTLIDYAPDAVLDAAYYYLLLLYYAADAAATMRLRRRHTPHFRRCCHADAALPLRRYIAMPARYYADIDAAEFRRATRHADELLMMPCFQRCRYAR